MAIPPTKHTRTTPKPRLDHTPTAPKPRVSRSRTTNDPLALPPGLRGTTTEGRRWLDLVSAYQQQLGQERMRRENVRAQVGSLVSLTLINERLNAEVARGEPVDPNHIIQVSQTITGLLAQLGLSAGPEPRDATPTLAQFLASKENAA